jgi:hypothetical protein
MRIDTPLRPEILTLLTHRLSFYLHKQEFTSVFLRLYATCIKEILCLLRVSDCDICEQRVAFIQN